MKNYQTTKIKISGYDIESQIERAYNAMFTPNSEYPYIINIRNFIPDILRYEDGVQRYSKFNVVRKKIFTKFNVTEYPTACALGSFDDTYTLIYTRARTPARFFSNTNQIDPFNYPSVYGVPLFSRAAIHDNNLLISGTASIRGSETWYKDDLFGQIDLTLNNIGRLMTTSGVTNSDLVYTIYVKNKESNQVVKHILQKYNISGKIINVDICRDDLLVEIEAYSRNLKL